MEEIQKIVSNLNAPPKRYNASGALQNSEGERSYSEPLFAVKTWNSLSEAQKQAIVQKYTVLKQGYTKDQLVDYIRGRLVTFQNQPNMTHVQVLPVRAGNTHVSLAPLPPITECKRLTSSQIAGLLWDRSTIDLSYGSPLHCELLSKLGKKGPLGSISWSELDEVLPSKDYTSGIARINLTNQRMSSGQIIEFIDSLKTKYPAFKPTSILIGGNDIILEKMPEVLESLQKSVQRRVPGLILQAGGKRSDKRSESRSKKVTRRPRGTRKVRWRRRQSQRRRSH
jgi:hypothetical protein